MMEWVNQNWWIVGPAIITIIALLYQKGYFSGSNAITSTVLDPTLSPEVALYRNIKRITSKANEKEAANELIDILRAHNENPNEIRLKAVDANPKS